MAQMFGWSRAAAACASRSSRASPRPSVVPGVRILMATFRFSRVSSARYTVPIPPAPSFPRISYWPNLEVAMHCPLSRLWDDLHEAVHPLGEMRQHAADDEIGAGMRDGDDLDAIQHRGE